MNDIASCLPPVLVRNQQLLRENLEAALGTLPSELAQSFEQDLRRAAQGSLTRWLFQMICLHSGFGSVTLYAGPIAVFSYGIQTDLRSLPREAWVETEKEFQVGEQKLRLYGILPAKSAAITNQAIDAILVHAENVFLNSHGLREKSIQNIFAPVERELRPILEGILADGTAVTLTHFLFQDMRVYFSLSGEYRSGEIMDSIQKIIRENLKGTDTIFRISPLSYIVVSPGADASQIEARFKTIYIQIKSLVLDYHLKLCTVQRLPVRFSQIWSQLL